MPYCFWVVSLSVRLSRFSAYHIARHIYARIFIFHMEPSNHKLKVAGRVAQLVAHLTQRPEVPGLYLVSTHAFVSPSADSSRAVFSYGGG